MTAAYLLGMAVLLLFWVVSGVITGRIAPWALAVTDSTIRVMKNGKEREEKQKELSASKLQALIWTVVTLFAYATVFGALLIQTPSGEPLPDLPTIPVNLLVLMGLSVITAAGAKGVTITYKAQDRIPDKSGGAVTDPEGNPQLVKAQMLVWTFVGAFWYLVTVVRFVDGIDVALAVNNVALPDVDGALLVLMGAAAGAYIGDKLVARDVRKRPTLDRVSPPSGKAGTEITLLGSGFGAERGQNFVQLADASGQEVLVRETCVWGNLQISKVKIPETFAVGSAVSIQVYHDGEYSEEKVFTVSD